MGISKPKKLRIYDPYFCDGVKRHLASIGFTNVYNENRDFYAEPLDREKYDVLVTNPPYSGSHVERLFRFCARLGNKPFFLLLPHHFYTKPYFKETIGTPTNVSKLFFLCPGMGRRYKYEPPSFSGAAAKERGRATTSPFRASGTVERVT